MSMKRMAVLLGCISSSVLMISAGYAAETARRPAGSLLKPDAAAGADIPFDLRSPSPDKANADLAGQPLRLTNLDPTAGSRVRLPEAKPQRNQPAKVDESALRFYASQNDAARVSMEIKRIKALYPTWEAPSDLFDEARDPAIEQKLWDLFAERRMDEIRATVEEIRKADPAWQPSGKFVEEFDRAEARLQLVAASDAKDAAGVLGIAETHPAMLVCADVDVMWRVAEALVQTNETGRAQDVYRYILTRCPNPAERLATIQKAMELLPAPAVKSLIALGQGRTGGAREFDSMQLDLLRKQIGTGMSGAGGEGPVPAELRGFETLVAQKKIGSDAVLLGWYYYSLKNWPVAGQWFKSGMEWERLPKAAEGYALALRQQGQLSEAETVAYQWRDADPLIKKLFIEIVATALTQPQPGAVDAERLARMEEAVERANSANGAQALGWYYYNTQAFPKARPWFSKAVAWEANETNVMGLALAAHRTKDQALFRKTVTEHGTRYPAVAALLAYDRKEVARTTRKGRGGAGSTAGAGGGGSKAGQLAELAVSQYKNGQYREALATLDKRGAVAREDQGLGVLRGWAHYHLSQYDKARDHFTALNAKQPTRDTQYGLYYSSSKLDPLHLGD